MERPTVIITGASRGLGAATAQFVAAQGANLVLAARSAADLERIADETHALGVVCDVRQEESCMALIERALQTYGQIDALVNNAGIIEPIARLADADLQEWKNNLNVNLLGPVTLIHAALPALRQSRGRIVNISSGASHNVMPGWTAYSAAKAAIDQLTRVLAEEEPQLTVLSLHPGILDTSIQDRIRANGQAAMSEKDYNRMVRLHEAGQLIPAAQAGKIVASLALFAPQEWSGQILTGDEERLQQLAARLQQ